MSLMGRKLARIIVAIALLNVGLASCQSLPSTSSNDEVALAEPSSLATLEQAIYQQINQYRASRKLTPLKLDPRISQYARIHSERMASETVLFSHAGFEERTQAIGDAIPYQQVAENIAVNKGNPDPVKVAVQGWIKSSGHRQNIEGQFDLTGIGIAKNALGEYYFTQIFLKERPQAKSLPIKSEPKATKTNPSPLNASFLVSLEREAYRQVNQYRASRNLVALKLDPRLSQEARLYSQQMAQGKAPFSHQGIEKRFKQVEKILPYRKAAENLAVNKGYLDPVTTAVQGWINSSGHRKAMEGEYDVTGIGIAQNPKGEYYFTQFFLKKS
jgi:uncharacterized protein YkwD